MAVSEDEMIVETTDYFVSENILNPKATAAEVAAFVRGLQTTGVITTTVNAGGVQGVVVVERQKLDEAESNACRRELGMDYEVEDDDDEE